MSSLNECGARLRIVGALLFLTAFLVPEIEHGENGFSMSHWGAGFGAFVMTPIIVVHALSAGSTSYGWFVGLALAAAWLNNFSMLLRFSRRSAWIPMLTPWILMLLATTGSSFLGRLWAFIPFYPWALGIGLYHLASLLDSDLAFDTWIKEF